MGRSSHTFPTERKYQKRCRVCGTTFNAARPDAKTCSNKCRLKLSRMLARENGEYMSAEQAARGQNESDAIKAALRLLKGR